jgi:hypothetical protein
MPESKATLKSDPNVAKPKCAPSYQEQSASVRCRARAAASPMARVKLTKNADSTTSTEPCSHKQSAIVRSRARESARPIPRVKLTENEDTRRSTEAFAGALSKQAFANLIGFELPISDARLELMGSVLVNTKPRDQTSAMLLMHMADMHKAAMTYAHRLEQAKSIAEADIWERALNRIHRTFVCQWEAYNRYQSGREQRATAPHVSVSQAIVANVTPAPREIAPSDTAPSDTAASPPTRRFTGATNDDCG